MPPDQHVNPAEEPSPSSSPRPPVTRIGRHPGNDMVVADLGVSKQHAELRRTPDGRYSIIDLGSHRGTYVNGTRVSQRELNEGDIITIGHATFRLAGGELVEGAGDGTARPATPEEAKTALQRERDLTAELRRQLDARERRIDSLQAELRVLAGADPALLPVLDRLGIRPEPEA
jgi:pSer/pThr/pTyr-binding forkhead associated (FHA) protein